jgi:hypothetical protein
VPIKLLVSVISFEELVISFFVRIEARGVVRVLFDLGVAEIVQNVLEFFSYKLMLILCVPFLISVKLASRCCVF